VKDANNCKDTMTVPLVNRNVGNTYVNFLVSSSQNAYDTLVVKEVCSPKPDSVKWEFPATASVIDYDQFSPRLRFANEGTYRIKMTPYFGGCDLPMEKDIVIKPFDSTIVYNNPNIVGIDTVMIMPNPNNGQFSLQVKLFRNQKLDVYIRSVNGSLIYYRHWNSVKEIMETINMNANGFLPAGSYFLKVVTDNDARDKLIIKQ
jgi:large repetitive protein